MNNDALYSDLLCRYRSACSVRPVSLLEFCRDSDVNYYSFLGWYGHFRKKSESVSASSVQESSGCPSGVSSAIRVSSDKPCKKRTSSSCVGAEDTDVISIRLKLRSGIEISKRHTDLETIINLLEKLRTLC